MQWPAPRSNTLLTIMREFCTRAWTTALKLYLKLLGNCQIDNMKKKNLYIESDVNCSNFVENIFYRKWATKDENQDTKILPEFQSCLFLNISSCQATEESNNFVVTIYNPMSQTAMPYVRIPVQGKAYSVKNPDGKKKTNSKMSHFL